MTSEGTPTRGERRAQRAARPVAINPTPRAGRNLYAAIGTGALLGLIIVGSLFWRKELFVVVATIASVIGAWEFLRALGERDITPPAVPTLAGAAVVPPVAYFFGAEALAPAVLLVVLAILAWRSLGDPRDAAADVAGGAFITLYVPALVSFAMLLLQADDGPWRVVTFVVVTVCSDIGGYAVGVVAGRHPMAPTVSPKKSWEGFAGSVLFTVVGGALTVHYLLQGRWWVGAILGVLVVVAATIGDLCESMLKRDLGIKDMSNLIPGHGGIMDRLDSLVIAVPVVWAVLTPFVPVS
ncbi:phosphatidate cytidylyltransferase [Calidifontibacter sp. DB0510]|uniref:Phosphatidate cytidylyltransferase n=1 Tax=Metallococcus carri TaxID=1656884 RepID=A0A967AXM3_9MICO|nr:phosphatidate cytidylyltransferase [Metallococcus carri]NHN54322.1 phosphatidate cytidylyltransferase [Metallococcus carri]NOP36838.1 phosphatidate cytidylyltransferase [Calidifontibacter sp. DB2511S]